MSQEYVLAYQTAGTTEWKSISIPVGSEDKVDAAISQHHGIKLPKHDLVLTDAEIKGIFTIEEFENLRRTFMAAPGYRSFLELGVEMKRKVALAKYAQRTRKRA